MYTRHLRVGLHHPAPFGRGIHRPFQGLVGWGFPPGTKSAGLRYTAPAGAKTAADQVVAYEAKWTSTLRQEQPAVVAGQVVEALRGRGVRRVGIDASVVSSQVAIQFKETEAIDSELWQMRRQKDPDELKLMRKAIACTVAMYRRAKEIIEPGVAELEVFTELNKAAVMEAGEPLTELLGNDFRCAARGGAPREDHKAGKGELYILDLGPVYRGYFSDNAR